LSLWITVAKQPLEETPMAKRAIVATVKTAPGRRDEYLKHLRAHADRCREW
jgi:hypothetical protein